MTENNAEKKVLPVLTKIPPGDLVSMTEREITSRMAMSSTAYTSAVEVIELTESALVEVLTEQVARRVLADRPGAEILVVIPAGGFCLNENGTFEEKCTGHRFTFEPVSVMSADGTEFDMIDALSPVRFWLERLYGLLDFEDEGELVLELASREWCDSACDDDCECEK